MDFAVVGAVADGHALVGAAEALSPDVIVSDIGMPGLDGIEAAKRLLCRDRAARIVFNGTRNAAERLGIHPNTLRFRMKNSASCDAAGQTCHQVSRHGRPSLPPSLHRESFTEESNTHLRLRNNGMDQSAIPPCSKATPASRGPNGPRPPVRTSATTAAL